MDVKGRICRPQRRRVSIHEDMPPPLVFLDPPQLPEGSCSSAELEAGSAASADAPTSFVLQAQALVDRLSTLGREVEKIDTPAEQGRCWDGQLDEAGTQTVPTVARSTTSKYRLTIRSCTPEPSATSARWSADAVCGVQREPLKSLRLTTSLSDMSLELRRKQFLGASRGTPRAASLDEGFDKLQP